MICAPHRTQLWARRPLPAPPFQRRASLPSAAGPGAELPGAPAPLLTMPNPAGAWPKLTDFWPYKGVGIHSFSSVLTSAHPTFPGTS